MWHTQEGDRVLQGKEWALFRMGLEVLWDELDAFEDNPDAYETGIAVFDRLEKSQKLAMLAFVGTALSEANFAAPDLTALSEGTVAAVFSVIQVYLETEITLEGSASDPNIDQYSIRRMVRSAYCEANPESKRSLPRVKRIDPDTWSSLLESLEERILWDMDYAAEEALIDSDPALAHARMAYFGIPQDYFTDVAPDPAGDALNAVRDTLRRLTRHERR